MRTVSCRSLARGTRNIMPPTLTGRNRTGAGPNLSLGGVARAPALNYLLIMFYPALNYLPLHWTVHVAWNTKPKSALFGLLHRKGRFSPAEQSLLDLTPKLRREGARTGLPERTLACPFRASLRETLKLRSDSFAALRDCLVREIHTLVTLKFELAKYRDRRY